MLKLQSNFVYLGYYREKTILSIWKYVHYRKKYVFLVKSSKSLLKKNQKEKRKKKRIQTYQTNPFLNT